MSPFLGAIGNCVCLTLLEAKRNALNTRPGTSEPSRQLVAINRPCRILWDTACVHFEVQWGADFLNQFSYSFRFATVLHPGSLDPASLGMIAKREATAGGGEENLVAVSPIVTDTQLTLDPHKAARVAEAPSVDNIEGNAEESVGRP